MSAILDFGRHFEFFFGPIYFFLHLLPWTTHVPSLVGVSQSERFTPYVTVTKLANTNSYVTEVAFPVDAAKVKKKAKIRPF